MAQGQCKSRPVDPDVALRPLRTVTEGDPVATRYTCDTFYPVPIQAETVPEG